jgi:molecular chaperone DnaK (HSP70)
VLPFPRENLVNVGESGMKKFAPEEISAMVLGKMRDIAEGFLGEKVTHAVLVFS